ncbi:hypothetical protein ACSX1A_19355 [Pontibacter sp. MBLB2868]
MKKLLNIYFTVERNQEGILRPGSVVTGLPCFYSGVEQKQDQDFS